MSESIIVSDDERGDMQEFQVVTKSGDLCIFFSENPGKSMVYIWSLSGNAYFLGFSEIFVGNNYVFR